ncbi:hypothetical protein N825_25385 [Skermanella stibiiresistens SB22]|uniref:Uncharacterized protein n=1 Tax=Skermanella stibiiresistens SB22 TaxID=1385369 RepID=W9GSA7_9PROT|nr:hypothetical protein [Skermanella stibiiresistens]EWY36770.1 hypothetical protein N825_25385 [Skermanella stibiiresistens SB22]
MEPQAALNLVSGIVGLLMVFGGVIWRVGALLAAMEAKLLKAVADEAVEGRARAGRMHARIDELKERLAKVEYQVGNDITGRRAVAEMSTRVSSLEGQLAQFEGTSQLAEVLTRGIDRIADLVEPRGPRRVAADRG